MAPGLSVSGECQGDAGVAGYRPGKVSDSDICARVLLARASGVQELYGAQEQYGVLGGQGRQESGAGPGGVEAAGGEGVERDNRLGMRVEEGGAGGDRGARGGGDCPERGDSSLRSE